MSIQSEITRISGNVSDALTAISNKGVTVPSGSNSDDLATLIGQITGGGGASATTVVTTQDSHGGDIVTITTGIDISSDTVAADKLLYGYTAHAADGTAITGSYTPPSPSLQAKTNISPTTSSQTIEADTGYDGLSSVQINAMPSGSATTPATTVTANPTISVSSGGLITATASATQSVTPTVSAGYVSSGTAGTITVSGSNTSQLTTQAAQTIHPSTSDQTIASGTYLTGAQTVKAVTLANLTAGNIKKDVTIKIGDSTDDDCVTSVTGTFEGGITPSGSITITTNTTTDVTNYATAVTNIPDAYTLTDVSNTTGTTAQITAGSGGGGGGATQHEIHLEFTDSTDADIDVYYDDSLIGTMITAYNPSGDWTYSSKTVASAALDNVTWYERPTVTWETLYENNETNFISDTPYNYMWLSSLSSVYPTAGSVWRVTIDNSTYQCTAASASTSGGNIVCFGNPKYTGGTDNGSDAPFNMYNAGYGAMMGDTELAAGNHYMKIERQTSA